MRRLDLDTSSDQHLPEHSGGGRHWSSGPDYSPLAGAEPMPDGSRGGNYFSQIKHGQFEMAASVLPSSQTDPKLNPMSGMGGLSANAQRREAAGAAIQAIGHYKDPVTQAGIVFSASTEVGSGRGLSLSNDAAASGVEALPGGRVGEIKLLFLDGSSSVALAYEKKGLGVKTDIKFSKHNNFGTYYISTYLIFNSTPPRR